MRPEEVLKPGALYRECAVVQLNIPPPPSPPSEQPEKQKKSDEKIKSAKSSTEGSKDKEVLDVPDDGEFGGERLGRMVWEWYEDRLKGWEAESKAKVRTKTETTTPDVGGEVKDDREAST